MCPFEMDFRVGSGQGNGAGDKTVRVLRMAWLLQAGDHTVDELARQFGVSRRTVYRDLRLIEKARLPLVSQSAGKGYRLMNHRPSPFDRQAQRPWV